MKSIMDYCELVKGIIAKHYPQYAHESVLVDRSAPTTICLFLPDFEMYSGGGFTGGNASWDIVELKIAEESEQALRSLIHRRLTQARISAVVDYLVYLKTMPQVRS